MACFSPSQCLEWGLETTAWARDRLKQFVKTAGNCSAQAMTALAWDVISANNMSSDFGYCSAK